METCGAASDSAGKKLQPPSKANKKKKSFVLESMSDIFVFIVPEKERSKEAFVKEYCSP